jgi:C1A family cysteine protease
MIYLILDKMNRTFLSLLFLSIFAFTFITSQELNHGSLQIRDSIMDKLLESSSPDLFKAYHMLFKKEYSLTSPEGILRKKIFEVNVREIKETNAKNLSYTLGINHFADLSKSEFKAKYLTLKQAEADALFGKDIIHYNENFNLDQSGVEMKIDWTNNFRPALQQGGCGSCWAFSTTGVIEGNYDIKYPKEKKVAFSPQYLVDCDTNWNAGCNGGDPGTALKYVIANGIPYETAYPYKGVDMKCNTSPVRNMVVTKVESCYRCSKEQIKGLLSKGPTSVVIDGSVIQLYKNGIFEGNCEEVNHAVIMAGASIDKSGNGYYLVRNSWDVTWGEKGYIRVKAGSTQNSCFLENGHILPIVKKSDEPEPDPPAPQCAKVYTECGFKGLPYEICDNTPIVQTAKTSGIDIGKFTKAKLFMAENCMSGFYTINSSWDCFDGYPLKNGLKSIMVGDDPTPPFGCVWIFDGSCLSGEKLELCSPDNDLSSVDNKKGWNKKISSVAVGPGIRYTLNSANGWSTTRNFHAYGLNSNFARNVNRIIISPA